MLLIKNAHVKTMAGQDIENGYVLIGDDGKIVSVGDRIDETSDMEIIDAEGRLVTPGCVEGHCHIGLSDLSGADYNEKSNPITPEMRSIDGINPQNESFYNALSGGVTTACVGPGSANIVCGTFAAVKCAGKRVDDMIVKHPIAMKCAFGENPKRIYGGNGKAPMTRMGIAAMLRQFLYKAKKYYNDKLEGKNEFDMGLEAMVPVMAGEIPLKAHAHRADDIFTSIRIAKEFGIKITLDHCTEGAMIAEELAKEGFPALVGPSMCNKSKYELLNKTFTTPAVLHSAGMMVAITTDANVTPIQYLPLVAGMAVKSGLPYEEGWKAITINPAKITGIADRVGSLEPGKDGDLVIWQDDPLTSVGAAAHVTIVDGKVAYRYGA